MTRSEATARVVQAARYIEISLRHGLVLLIDGDDWARLGHHSWWAYKNGNTFYVCRTAKTPRGRRHVPIHREIMGAQPGFEVDHINRDGLDNRRTNLRVCTRAQNTENAPHPSGKYSNYRGVSWDITRDKWTASISIKNRATRLGRFADEADAARAYDVAARQHHGEFAITNFPDGAAP